MASFRGGFGDGDAVPGRSRRPQPTYDNYKYGGVSFAEHELIYLEANLIMDWQPRTGQVSTLIHTTPIFTKKISTLTLIILHYIFAVSSL